MDLRRLCQDRLKAGLQTLHKHAVYSRIKSFYASIHAPRPSSQSRYEIIALKALRIHWTIWRSEVYAALVGLGSASSDALMIAFKRAL